MAKASKNAKKRSPTRYRMMFRFWMDGNKDDELAIADYCEEQKSKRSFTSTMRDALRLIMDLRQQRLDVLFELFPFVNAWLEERAEAIASSKNKVDGGDSGSGNIINLSAKIERLENLLLQQTAGGNGMLLAARNAQLRALPAPRQEADLEERIEIKKAANGGDAVTNYLRALTDAGGVKFELSKPAASGAGLKKMTVQQFDIPAFDEDDTVILMT